MNAQEAKQALLDGHKIKSSKYPAGEYLVVLEGLLKDETGFSIALAAAFDLDDSIEWSLYEPFGEAESVYEGCQNCKRSAVACNSPYDCPNYY